jgi:hypothetical protein
MFASNRGDDTTASEEGTAIGEIVAGIVVGAELQEHIGERYVWRGSLPLDLHGIGLQRAVPVVVVERGVASDVLAADGSHSPHSGWRWERTFS